MKVDSSTVNRPRASKGPVRSMSCRRLFSLLSSVVAEAEVDRRKCLKIFFSSLERNLQIYNGLL